MRVLVIGEHDFEFEDLYDFFRKDDFIEFYFTSFVPNDLEDFSVICSLDINKHPQLEFIHHIPIICLYETSYVKENMLIINERDSFNEIKKALYFFRDNNYTQHFPIKMNAPKTISQDVIWIKIEQNKLNQFDNMLQRYVSKQKIKEEIATQIKSLICELLSNLKNKIVKAKMRIDPKYVDLHIDGCNNLSSYFLNKFAHSVQVQNNHMVIGWVN